MMMHPNGRTDGFSASGADGLEAPRLVFWELTARCNLACRHCRVEATAARAPDEPPVGELLRMADAIRADFDPIMVLTGGEPLMHPDFFRIARHCAARFTRVAMGTNGVLIDRKVARDLAAAGIRRAGVSLDGAGAGVHDAFRGQPGSFEGALRGIACLRAAGVPVQINATMTRHNEHELDALLQLALDVGADAFHLFMLVPVGCGMELSDDQRLPPARFDAALRRLHARSVELAQRLFIKATCAPQYMRIARQAGEGGRGSRAGGPLNAMTGGCLAGSGVCFVSRTGNVQPCGYLPLAVGNLRRRDLGEIWRNSEVFGALRDPSRLRGKCGDCGFRRICRGCRARAYAQSGGYLDEEPACPYEPGDGGKA